MMNDIFLSAVVPSFNEAVGIRRCLEETVEALEALGFSYEVILVDDGSQDDTSARARETARNLPHVRLIETGTNLGKGAALVRGTEAARGELVLFMDADLEVHPRQVALLHKTLVDESADAVIGSKLHPDSRIDYPRGRRVLSLGYYLLVRVLFGLPVRDTQTGLKLFRAEALREVVPRLLVKRFAHDLEALVALHRVGYRIVEAPVIVTRERAYPRIGRSDVRRIAQDTAAIWYRTYIRHWYDRPPGKIEAAPASERGRAS